MTLFCTFYYTLVMVLGHVVIKEWESNH